MDLRTDITEVFTTNDLNNVYFKDKVETIDGGSIEFQLRKDIKDSSLNLIAKIDGGLDNYLISFKITEGDFEDNKLMEDIVYRLNCKMIRFYLMSTDDNFTFDVNCLLGVGNIFYSKNSSGRISIYPIYSRSVSSSGIKYSPIDLTSIILTIDGIIKSDNDMLELSILSTIFTNYVSMDEDGMETIRNLTYRVFRDEELYKVESVSEVLRETIEENEFIDSLIFKIFELSDYQENEKLFYFKYERRANAVCKDTILNSINRITFNEDLTLKREKMDPIELVADIKKSINEREDYLFSLPINDTVYDLRLHTKSVSKEAISIVLDGMTDDSDIPMFQVREELCGLLVTVLSVGTKRKITVFFKELEELIDGGTLH